MNKIKTTSQLAKQAFSDLKLFQSGERKLLKTGRDYIDKHIGGLIPSNLLLIGANSGGGKTHEFMRMMNGILSEDNNPQAKDFVSLEYLLEMKYLDLVVREAHTITGKKKADILTSDFNEEEKELMNEYFKTLTDGRRFIVEESITTTEFLEITDKFCDENRDKKAIIIGIDHLLLILASEKGEDPLAKIAQYTNILRKKYDNLYFIYLSQLNRTNYANVKEKSNLMVPTVASIYGSSHFEFLSAYVVIMSNPFRQGISEYMKVYEDRYPDLKEFMTDPNEKGYVSFDTIGNYFYHIVKLRDSDYMYDNLYIEKMNISEEVITKMKMDVVEEKTPTFSDFKMPVFNPPSEIPAMSSGEAFGDF